MSSVLEEFKEINRSSSPNRLIMKAKEEGKKIIGWACNYVPEEIIHAADMVPYRVLGKLGKTDTPEADSILNIYSCSFTRSCLQGLIEGDFDFLDGFINSATCDGMRRLGDAWAAQLNADVPFLYNLSLPHKLNDYARSVYADEIVNACKIIEDKFEVEISDRALKESINVFNHGRRLMKRLYDLRKSDPPGISGYNVMEVLNSMVVMPREDFNSLLERLLKEIGDGDKEGNGKIRLMVNGSIMDDAQFIKGIEELGAWVVTDSLCNGSRAWWGEVDDSVDNPIESLAKYYLDKIPCPRMEPSKARFDYLTDLIGDFNVEGVISEIIRYCAINIFDEPRVRGRLEDINTPSLILEVEYGMSITGQVKTRVQAFIELLNERRKGQ